MKLEYSRRIFAKMTRSYKQISYIVCTLVVRHFTYRHMSHIGCTHVVCHYRYNLRHF